MLVVIFLLAITQIATPIEADIAAVTEPITDLHPWPKRPDAALLTADRAEIEALLRRFDT